MSILWSDFPFTVYGPLGKISENNDNLQLLLPFENNTFSNDHINKNPKYLSVQTHFD